MAPRIPPAIVRGPCRSITDVTVGPRVRDAVT
jgi:hypothetical protein